MELERNKLRMQETRKMMPLTLLMGVLLMLIPLGAAILMSKPELGEMIKSSRGEIFRGTIIGASALPVFLLVGIKGQKTWYKKVGYIVLVSLTILSILAIVLVL